MEDNDVNAYSIIDGKTRVCGIIGNPVGHTKSPVIHNTLAKRLGHNMVYVPFPVKEANMKTVIQGAHALHIEGMNVTIPFKQEVLPYLIQIDKAAERIGAVNTLKRTGEGYAGYNTDMPGLFRAMESDGVKLRGEQIILIGAGGAARAVAFLCADKQADRVYLLNRTKEKAIALAKEVNTVFNRDLIIPMGTDEYHALPEEKYLAVQATEIGLYPEVKRVVIDDEDFYRKIHTGYELIYTPLETKFMSLVKSAGGKAYNGLKMLLYQAVLSYEIWNGVSVSIEDAEFIYDKLMAVCGHRGA